MDIYQFAMEMELAGREHYLKMVEATQSAAGKKIFQILADEELRHYEYLKEQSRSSRVVVETDQVEAAEKAFTAMLGTEEFQSYPLAVDSYTQGILLEDSSVRYYKERAMTEPDTSARVLFLKLYFEEKKHKLLLENILEVIQEPEMHLESPELERPLKQDI